MEIIKENRKYECPKCGCTVIRAMDNGNRVFVHETCNGYANHEENCPKRKPIIQNNIKKEDNLKKDILKIISKYQKNAKPKTTPKKASKKNGIKPKKDGKEKRNKQEDKGSKEPLSANKGTKKS